MVPMYNYNLDINYENVIIIIIIFTLIINCTHFWHTVSLKKLIIVFNYYFLQIRLTWKYESPDDVMYYKLDLISNLNRFYKQSV